MGNDGLLYVCDRNGDRIQVFDKTGAFKRNIPTPILFRAPYTGNGGAGSLAFSRDAAQKYMYVGDFSDKLIRVFDRVSGKELSQFGRPGSHQLGGIASPHAYCHRFKRQSLRCGVAGRTARPAVQADGRCGVERNPLTTC